jgi:glycosyltransferase involved in cell wall biosynthesis
MPVLPQNIALVYDDDAYVELLERPTNRPPDAAQGLMGRQVAGREFLDAYFTHGRWQEMVALVFGESSRESLIQFFRTHPAIVSNPARKLRIIGRHLFHSRFLAKSAAPVLHWPCPPDSRYAWARSLGGQGSFALTGLTHTISTVTVMKAVADLVAAPYESFDALICISTAAMKAIRGIADNYAAYLNDRHGGSAKLRVRLTNIPLGVNNQRYRPATDDQRRAERLRLGIAEDAIVVLFVGRLTFTGKVHPFPIYDALQAASRRTGKAIHLVMSGWSPSEAVIKIMRDGAGTFAPGVRITIVDGTKPENRFPVWNCADIFTSPTDNIQETLSQVILEAMSCGLPVVATDWDGCRDQVIPGETGFLVPTYMVRGATTDLSSRHLIEEMPYGSFLADCNQTVAVDSALAADAFVRLIEDPALRKRMGEAGRKRAVEVFNWAKIVHAYEDLWSEQDEERRAFQAAAMGKPKSSVIAPALFPPLDDSFASYPMAFVEDESVVRAEPDALERLSVVLATPLSNYRPENRCADATILAAALRLAMEGIQVSALDGHFQAAGVSHTAARASLGWMLKYRLLRVESK